MPVEAIVEYGENGEAAIKTINSIQNGEDSDGRLRLCESEPDKRLSVSKGKNIKIKQL